MAESPFENFIAQEGIPILRGYSADNLRQVPLEPWARKGGLGAAILLAGGQGYTGAYLCEIPSGFTLKPQKHLFEERIFILEGKGKTSVWNQGGSKQTIEWQKDSLFSPPLNTWHQHQNLSEKPARYLAVTNAPAMFNLLDNSEFIFNCDFVFRDRFNEEPGYFDGLGRMTAPGRWAGGFMKDVHALLPPVSAMGERFGLLRMQLSRNRTWAHIALLEPGTYKKAHRHTPGAHVIILNGKGYSLMWRQGQEKERVRIDWQEGSVFSPPEGWFHQHFNTCSEPVRQLALRWGVSGFGKGYKPDLDIKLGGDQIEYEDEDPEIREIFEAELRKTGLKTTMNY